MNDKPIHKTWSHFIGMCGVTMAPLANMLQDKGLLVTGSDKGIYAPISEYIKENNLKMSLGFKPEHLTAEFLHAQYSSPTTHNSILNTHNSEPNTHNSFPDFIVVGNFTGPSNPEYKFAEEKGIQKYSYPEIMAKYVIKPNSIVIAGTYGKTTNSALLSLIFQKAGKDPSYMFGGISDNFDHGVKSTDSDWSIVEGDEYISARWDQRSKFFHYSPKYLLLTSAAWDHSDVYKTEQDYIDNFKKLIQLIPEDGLIVACANGKNVDEVISPSSCLSAQAGLDQDLVPTKLKQNIVTYSTRFNNKKFDSDYYADNLKTNEKGFFEFSIYKNSELIISIETKLIGLFNYENITGAVVLALELGIEKDVIKNAVKEFAGIKRRLEIIHENKDFKVIDDFAASPPKIKGSTLALKRAFPDSELIVIHEPNTGSRSYDSLKEYDELFKNVDEVIIPRLRGTKIAKGERRYSGEELVDRINKSSSNAKYIPNDSELMSYIKTKSGSKTIIAFMGSGGFRGMREGIANMESSEKLSS